jgi:hypothetical protein
MSWSPLSGFFTLPTVMMGIVAIAAFLGFFKAWDGLSSAWRASHPKPWKETWHHRRMMEKPLGEREGRRVRDNYGYDGY